MITSKLSTLGDAERSCANMVNASVTNVPSEKKFRFIKRLTVSNADVDVNRRAEKAKVTLPGQPIGRRKPNSTEKPFWSETILSKGPTGYSRPQTQPRDNREIRTEERGKI